ncbi:MAG: hypothetical protein KJ887_03725 [Candidatus Omnitrophica bacterium]|nr:hypothetical protein [Candidatus Omnitrophota bacterium]MBU1047430.1 hypothetical protein [Candidatus Omnitrophota bacterium]MBU1630835.1 hypothetical protein [Candidatus Omnitrophota bacterium]MBU1888793.1 hypothetical protein [Candidatus Omnitrophota bacterium]
MESCLKDLELKFDDWFRRIERIDESLQDEETQKKFISELNSTDLLLYYREFGYCTCGRPFGPSYHPQDKPYKFFRVRLHNKKDLGESKPLQEVKEKDNRGNAILCTRFKSAKDLWCPPFRVQAKTGRAGHPTEAVLYLSTHEELAKKETLPENEIKNGEFSLIEAVFSNTSNADLMINYFGYDLDEPIVFNNFEHGQFIKWVKNGVTQKVIKAYGSKCEDVDQEMELWELKYKSVQKYFMSRKNSRFIQAVISSVMWRYGQGLVEALAYPSVWWGKGCNVDCASNFSIRESIANKKLKIRRAWYCKGESTFEYPEIDCLPPYDRHNFPR